MLEPTFHQRAAFAKEFVNDEQITPIETLTYIYHFIQFERLRNKRIRIQRRVQKHGKELYSQIEVVNLRKQMNGL